jgi:trans-aconitate methyltransferase
MSEIKEFGGNSNEYNEYLRKMPEMAPTTQQIVDSLLVYMDDDFKRRNLVLGDVGCGPGTSTRYYVAKFLESGLKIGAVVGVETREDAVVQAKAGQNFGVNMNFYQGDATNMSRILARAHREYGDNLSQNEKELFKKYSNTKYSDLTEI